MRMIDADALHAEISAWPESIMYKDWVQSAIANAPTLTQPNEGAKDKNGPTNETLTCEGCIHEHNEHENCNYCKRASYLGDYYYRRPPEGEL